MRLRRLVAAVFAFAILALSAGSVWWFLLGGKDRFRTALIERLKPVLGGAFDIESLSIYPTFASAEGILIDPSESIHIRIERLVLDFYFWEAILNYPNLDGVIEEVRIIDPRITVAAPPPNAGSSPSFRYKPFPLKGLARLAAARRIRIENLTSILAGEPRQLAENVNGLVDLTYPGHITLDLKGESPFLANAPIELDGEGDLLEGSFTAVFRGSLESLDLIPSLAGVEKLDVSDGKVAASVRTWGAEDLRFAGSFSVADLSFTAGEAFSVERAALKGELFGQRLETSGSAVIDGAPVIFNAVIPDWSKAKWEASLPEQVIRLEDLRAGKRALPAMKGEVRISLEASGAGTRFSSKAEIAAAQMEVAGITLQEIYGKLSLDSAALSLDSLSGKFAGGALQASGSLELKQGEIRADGSYRRQFPASEIPRWMAIQGSMLDATFQFARSKGVWHGFGFAALVDSHGIPQMNADLIADRGSSTLKITAPEGGLPLATISYTPANAAPYSLNVPEPLRIASLLMKPELIPIIARDYRVSLRASGDGERFRGNLDAISSDGIRGLTSSVKMTRRKEGWDWSNDLGVRLPGGRALIGDFEGSISSRRIEVRKGILSGAGGEKELDLTGVYDLANRKLARMSVNADGLPAGEILRLFKPNLSRTVGVLVSGRVETSNDSSRWNGEILLTKEREEDILLTLEGFANRNEVIVRRAIAADRSGDNLLLNGSGKVSFTNSSIDSMILSLRAFPAERALDFLAPEIAGRYRGDVSARIEIDGPFSQPRFEADAHLTRGSFHGASGFWGNLRCTTSDTGWVLEEFSLGRNIEAWVVAEGWRSFRGTERGKITGRNVEIGALLRATANLRLPLEANGGFDFLWQADEGRRSVVGAVAAGKGSFVDIPFDGVRAKLRFTGLEGRTPSLWFDSLAVDWGGAKGSMIGELPLTGGRAIEVVISVTGELPSLLPRMTSFFSNPGGTGRLDLTLGGTINDVRLLPGRLTLKDGRIRFRDVIGTLSGLNVDIRADDEGNLKIAQCTGAIDGTAITVSNRPPDPQLGEESIRILHYNLGVLKVLTAEEGIWIVIPGLMEEDWGGRLTLEGDMGREAFEFAGPAAKPRATGRATLSNAIITFPFLKGSGEPSGFGGKLVGFLSRIDWNAVVASERGCRYIREVSGLGGLPVWEMIKSQVFGGILDPDLKVLVDLRLDDNPVGLRFRGSVADSLRLEGEISSSQGSIELLDLKFEVEKAGVKFNLTELEPVIYGTAVTEVTDTTGALRQVRLRIKAPQRDEALEGEGVAATAADFSIALEDDQGRSQEQILQILGYTPEQLPSRLTGLGGGLVESATPLRRWTRLLERRIEQATGLDRITFESTLAKNLIERRFAPAVPAGESIPGRNDYWTLFYGSSITIGKYVAPNLYISYRGALAAPTEVLGATRLGIRHDWGALYRLSRISNNLTLNYRLEYNSLARSSINSMFIRYAWVFSLERQLRHIRR